MSTRLNANLRLQIIENALAKAGIPKATEAALDRKIAWGEAARLYVNGASDAKLTAMADKVKAAYNGIPEHMRQTLYRTVNHSRNLNLNLAGVSVNFEFEVAKPVPNSRAVIPTGHELVGQFYANADELAALSEKAGVLRAQLRATLAKVATVEALLKAWPEAKELIPANIPVASAGLPAVLIADLNAALGLPTDGAQAA